MFTGLDLSRRVTGVHGYSALLTSIETAAEEDEDEFVEWKSSLDLRSAAGQFAVARTILGFANRSPTVASQRFEGCGYLVVGVEPNGRDGVETVDPADFSTAIDAYVGGVDGPAWDARFLDYGQVKVLVVVVEPPRPGDGPWPLTKGNDKHLAGTLFVRRKGLTAPANPAEIRMLVERARAGAPLPFDITCVVHPDEPILRLDVAQYELNARQRAERHAASLRQEADAIVESGVSTAETRTLDQFNDELDQYVAAVIVWAKETVREAAWSELPDAHIRVVNLTDTYLMGVAVRLRFDEDRIICLDDEPDTPDAPQAPRPYGTRPPQAPTVLSRMYDPYIPQAPHFPTPSFDTWIEEDRAIVLDIGKLPPQGTFTSDPIKIIVPREVTESTLTAIGVATAEGHHRVVPVRLVAHLA